MRNGKVRLVAVAVSVALHAIWFVQSGGVPGAMQANTPTRTTVTRLTFATPEPVARPEPVALQEPVMEPLPKPDPVVQKPKPIPVKKPKPVKKKQPVLKAKRKTKPVTEKIDKPSVPVEPVQVASAPAAASPAAMVPAAPAIDEGLIERERQRYLASLMAHIEQYKWYPKSARRRRIEGMVHVDFTLFADGSTSDISVKNASPVLLAAAREAVAKAVPMPPPPAVIDCPMKCEFKMSFNLK
jgi:protein TonB